MHWRQQLGDHDARVDSVEQRGKYVVVKVSWADSNDNPHDWTHVVKLVDGKIIDMQDYARPSTAAFATRLRAVFGT